jgi:predicted nucleic acid-binding protein
MSEVVVDASLAVQWVIQEEHTREARALLRDWDAAQTRRSVPGWFACEVGNVFYKRVIRGRMTVTQAKAGVDVVLGQVTMLDVEPAMPKRALEFADTLGRPTTYDAHYLALAEHLGCELWTADERLWNASRATLPWVRWVGEVASP